MKIGVPSLLSFAAQINKGFGNDFAPKLSLCLFFAVLTGFTYTAGVLVLALPEHYAAREKRELSAQRREWLMRIYVLLNIVSVVPLVLALRNGPVAVAVPVMIAAQLLSNMVAQGAVGSLHYTKSMRAGTYILAIAAVQLIDVGPKSPTTRLQPLDIIAQPVAIAWLGLMASSLVASLCALPFVQDLPRDSVRKLVAFTVCVSVAAALNNSVSKVLFDVRGKALYCSVGVFLVFGAISTVVGGYGNARLNNALSVPAFTCMQVLVNGLTGIFVWGDAERIPNAIAYAGVYALILCGIYLCSTTEFDFIGMYVRHTELAENQANEDCVALLEAMGGVDQHLQRGRISSGDFANDSFKSQFSVLSFGKLGTPVGAHGDSPSPSSPSARSPMKRRTSFHRIFSKAASPAAKKLPLTAALQEFLRSGVAGDRIDAEELLELNLTMAQAMEGSRKGQKVLHQSVSDWAHNECKLLKAFMHECADTKNAFAIAEGNISEASCEVIDEVATDNC